MASGQVRPNLRASTGVNSMTAASETIPRHYSAATKDGQEKHLDYISKMHPHTPPSPGTLFMLGRQVLYKATFYFFF